MSAQGEITRSRTTDRGHIGNRHRGRKPDLTSNIGPRTSVLGPRTGAKRTVMAKTFARKKSTAKPAQAKKLAQPKKTAAAAKGAGKYVYLFGSSTSGTGTMKPRLGGRGATLAEMCRISLPVPPGFTITTEVCTYYYAN